MANELHDYWAVYIFTSRAIYYTRLSIVPPEIIRTKSS